MVVGLGLWFSGGFGKYDVYVSNEIIIEVG